MDALLSLFSPRALSAGLSSARVALMIACVALRTARASSLSPSVRELSYLKEAVELSVLGSGGLHGQNSLPATGPAVKEPHRTVLPPHRKRPRQP